jgi:hypothetical protein
MRRGGDHQVNSHPILVVVNAPNRFGAYTGEILKAEGFNAFQIEPLAELSLQQLNSFDIVILTETRLTVDQVELVRAYVSGGGQLVAFRPDKQLSDIFGIADAGCQVEDGYLRIETDTPTGAGLTAETLQFHGAADGYTFSGATPVAILFADPLTPTRFPAVICHTFGMGQTAAFTYNLPMSVVYTRQGNPVWAGQERDGIPGIRAAELFLGWTDPSKNHLNQADEQMHLLAHILEEFATTSRPLPRWWYFPGFNQCLVILTDDGEDSAEADFEQHFADIEAKGAQTTLYLKGPNISPAAVAKWTARGHEIACHFDDTHEAIQPTAAGMNAAACAMVKDHYEAYGLMPETVRNHWIVWVGWTEQAAIEASLGIGLDCNLYHYDRGSSHGDYLGGVGNFTGSGLPMKFANRGGRVIEVYQSLTQLPDEQWLEANLYGCFKILVDRSLDQEVDTFINVNFHTQNWQLWSRKPGLDMLDYANKRGVPLWTAERTLKFLEARDSARFKGICWADHMLSFSLEAPIAGQELTFMLPRLYNGLTLSKVERDGIRLACKRLKIKGRGYALAAAPSGGTFSIQATYTKRSRNLHVN